MAERKSPRQGQGGYPSNNTDPDLSTFSPLDGDAQCVACGEKLTRNGKTKLWDCPACGKSFQLQWQETMPTDGVTDEMGLAKTQGSQQSGWRRTFGDPTAGEVTN